MHLLVMSSQFGSQIGGHQRRGQSVLLGVKPWAKAKRSMYSIIEPQEGERHERLGDSVTSQKDAAEEEVVGHVAPGSPINVDRLLEQKTPLYEASSSLALTPMLPFGARFAQLSPTDQAFFILGFIACSVRGTIIHLQPTSSFVSPVCKLCSGWRG